jgi:hypothetical protein
LNGPKKNPNTPASWRADGMLGLGAKANRPCRRKDTPSEAVALLFARMAIESARYWLDRYAAMTDYPSPGTPEAADLLLEAARMIRGGGGN